MQRRQLVLAFWIIFSVTMVNIAVMMIWSLPQLQSMSGGLDPFDLRMQGYSFDDAQTMIAALGEEGRAFYANVQQMLDTSFPALNGLTIGLALFLLAPVGWGNWRVLLALIAVPGPVFDYLENAAVKSMLIAGPENLTAAMVESASGFTTTKALFINISFALLLAMLVWWAIRRFMSRTRNATQSCTVLDPRSVIVMNVAATHAAHQSSPPLPGTWPRGVSRPAGLALWTRGACRARGF